jgi:hypothetical protein
MFDEASFGGRNQNSRYRGGGGERRRFKKSGLSAGRCRPGSKEVNAVVSTFRDDDFLPLILASVNVGPVDVYYGATVGALIGLALAAGTARILWLYLAKPS